MESALEHAKILQDHDFHEFKISVKASDVFLAVAAYQQLADLLIGAEEDVYAAAA